VFFTACYATLCYQYCQELISVRGCFYGGKNFFCRVDSGITADMGSSGHNTYRVLGIDPGLNITGYGAVEFAGSAEPVVVEAGTIRTDTQASLSERISQIYADLVDLLGELGPDMVAVEQLYAHYKHPRTSILMAHARGVMMLAIQHSALPVRNVQATRVKKGLTGNGHATKRQMQLAIQTACKLLAPPEPPDVADALAIAICAGRELVY
jgi:crossover junction endodeoxyribonuclease RuvC